MRVKKIVYDIQESGNFGLTELKTKYIFRMVLRPFSILI